MEITCAVRKRSFSLSYSLKAFGGWFIGCCCCLARIDFVPKAMPGCVCVCVGDSIVRKGIFQQPCCWHDIVAGDSTHVNLSSSIQMGNTERREEGKNETSTHVVLLLPYEIFASLYRHKKHVLAFAIV